MEFDEFAKLDVKPSLQHAKENNLPVVVIYGSEKLSMVGKVVEITTSDELVLEIGSSKEPRIPMDTIERVFPYDPTVAGYRPKT